ncbi:saccharopine dehydrogenase NADP-binding domain-containing protein [Oscillatoria sp. CS-180]|uniref:saccharopine dehydrogenase family protein n=1 Tax=Oscillatoria sp. CS-180 TaxID=3021720 RepID=UPI0023310C7D|nr:saccharopine dehydrogenase NADP-binding domain-containing protein [Oscillatoria sp. CS-180]MDB9528979.1 saccharopine dehydrogenase NADP-binding domain-containing protein [Oscillatoria sp. CS-180]
MTDANTTYDLVVFGATGFVGEILSRYLLDQADEDALKWAIAGRSQSKLDNLSKALGPKAAGLPQLIADATDEASLRHLCTQTRVVISTVGPYALYGDSLVKICAETGTNYCDLTGEVQWIRRMIQTHSARAEKTGACIVHCCGFDSIPSDLGVYYLQQEAQQQLGSFCDQIKMRLVKAQGGFSGGTVASGINLVKEASVDSEVRQALVDPYSLCPEASSAHTHPPVLIPVKYDKDFQEWVTPFVMAAVNTRIVLRSNALQQQPYSEKFQYDEGILTGGGAAGWFVAQGLKRSMEGLGLAAAFSPTRWLLENSIVPAAGSGPSVESQQNGFYDLRFLGRTNRGGKIQVQVQGDRDPGYGSTARMLGQAGISLAKDIPESAKGGFWTPAALFGDNLIARLEHYAGLTFKVVDVQTQDEW